MTDQQDQPPEPRAGFRIVGDPAPLFAALARAQGAFVPAKKTAENPHFRKSYAPLEEVIAATQPGLTANELSVLQFPFGGLGHYTFVTQLAHASGCFIESSVDFKAEGIQQFASAITYLKRYTRASILGVATEDDDGYEAQSQSQAETKQPPRSQKTPPRPPTQVSAKLLPADPQMAAGIARRKAEVVEQQGGSPSTEARLEEARGVLAQAEEEAGVAPADKATVLPDAHVPDAVQLPKGAATREAMKAALEAAGYADSASMVGFIDRLLGIDPVKTPLTYGNARAIIAAANAATDTRAEP